MVSWLVGRVVFMEVRHRADAEALDRLRHSTGAVLANCLLGNLTADDRSWFLVVHHRLKVIVQIASLECRFQFRNHNS